MKNKQKSRSGCRTCKLRRLRCDETKPACRNCTQKGLECPGYQQRLQWSTKHERPSSATASGPENFDQLVTAASEVIGQRSGESAAGPSSAGAASTTTPDRGQASQRTTPTLSPGSSPDSSRNDGAMVPFIKRDSSPGPSEVMQNIPEIPLLQPVVNIPSFLIEHWFKSVCSSWSAYDSLNNPYRQLTSEAWSNSSPVFFALQAISAASLVERLPLVMRETARAAPRLATEAIKKGLIAFVNDCRHGIRPKFPSELLLSLFCMSSSMAWLESRELGLQYLKQARLILKTLETWALDDKEQQMLQFFQGCLIYEEMLRSVASENESDLKNMLSWPEPPDGTLIRVTSHPWTGVGTDVIRLFGKAIALCRRSRTRWRHNDGVSYRILQGAMQDIQEASVVEMALRNLDSTDVEQIHLPERDRHLYSATEAYRLSSLLQLYATFPDLIVKQLPPEMAETNAGGVWTTWVNPLAINVVKILEQIPESSMRCIQPLLCLCAGSGLRFDGKFPMAPGQQSYLLLAEQGGRSPPAMSVSTLTPEPDTLMFDHGLTDAAINTSKARRFVMDRLEQLALSLPPKPIDVAKQLLRAVWAAYDDEIGTPRRTHWLDVMTNNGLHSIFG
ncbi:fungal-specific transcription factor domain-containing protein [Podospora conica]|nr:fungal-specific transcription factor domain-containing protein [Schizothecium conicum]